MFKNIIKISILIGLIPILGFSQTKTATEGYVNRSVSNAVLNLVTYPALTNAITGKVDKAEFYSTNNNVYAELNKKASTNNIPNWDNAYKNSTNSQERLDSLEAREYITTNSVQSIIAPMTNTLMEAITNEAALRTQGDIATTNLMTSIVYSNPASYYHSSNPSNYSTQGWVTSQLGGLVYTNANNTYSSGTTQTFYRVSTLSLVTRNSAGLVQGQFAEQLPTYVFGNWPGLGFNAYWVSGVTWAYGAGSSSKYGMHESYDPTTGELGFYLSTAAGNIGETFIPQKTFALAKDGTVSVLAGPLVVSHTATNGTQAVNYQTMTGYVNSVTNNMTSIASTNYVNDAITNEANLRISGDSASTNYANTISQSASNYTDSVGENVAQSGTNYVDTSTNALWILTTNAIANVPGFTQTNQLYVAQAGTAQVSVVSGIVNGPQSNTIANALQSVIITNNNSSAGVISGSGSVFGIGTNVPPTGIQIGTDTTSWNPITWLSLKGTNKVQVSYDSLSANHLTLTIGSSNLVTHIDDSIIHITGTERTNWNNKAETSITNSLVSTNYLNTIATNETTLRISGDIDGTNYANRILQSSSNYTDSVAINVATSGTNNVNSATNILWIASTNYSSSIITGKVDKSEFYSTNDNIIIRLNEKANTNHTQSYTTILDPPWLTSGDITGGVSRIEFVATNNNVISGLSSKASTNELNIHTTNEVVHITGGERASWNSKAEITVTNGLAPISYVNSATTGLVTASITNGVFTSITNEASLRASGDSTGTNYVNSATNGVWILTTNLVTGATNALWISTTNAINTHVTNEVVHITSGERSAWNAKAETTITNGLASVGYVNSATTGLVTASITNGLAPISYVNSATTGLVTASITNGVFTSITNEAQLRVLGDSASSNYVDTATNKLWISTTNAIAQIPVYVQTNQLYVGQAGTAQVAVVSGAVTGPQSNTISSALQPSALDPYYLNSNPSNYITSAQIPAQTNQLYVASASNSTLLAGYTIDEIMNVGATYYFSTNLISYGAVTGRIATLTAPTLSSTVTYPGPVTSGTYFASYLISSNEMPAVLQKGVYSFKFRGGHSTTPSKNPTIIGDLYVLNAQTGATIQEFTSIPPNTVIPYGENDFYISINITNDVVKDGYAFLLKTKLANSDGYTGDYTSVFGPPSYAGFTFPKVNGLYVLKSEFDSTPRGATNSTINSKSAIYNIGTRTFAHTLTAVDIGAVDSTNTTYLSTVSLASTALQLVDLNPYYPRSNPSNYIALVQVPVQTQQVYVANAGHATTAGTVTGSQSNLISSALQIQTQQVYVATAGTATTVTGSQSNTIASALQAVDLVPYYPRSNPSNYITLASVPAQTTQVYVATAGTAVAVTGSQSNLLATAVQPAALASYYLNNNPSNYITLSQVPTVTDVTRAVAVTGAQSNAIASALQPDAITGMVTNNQTGVTLNTVRPANGFENQYAQTLSYDLATRVMTVTPTGSSFRVTSGYVTHTFVGAQSSTAAPLVADQYFYYNSAGQFVGTNTAWTIADEAQVGFVKMNTNNLSIVFTVDERHGVNISDEWHRQQHFTIGTKWASGMALYHNAADTTTPPSSAGLNTCISIQAGVMYDEDVYHPTVANGVQSSAAIAIETAGTFPVMYANTAGEWVRTTGTTFPFLYSGDIPQIVTNGSLAAVAEDRYFVYWLAAIGGFRGTNIFLIPHPVTFTSTALAQSGATPYTLGSVLGTLPSLEMLVTHRLIFLFNASGANSHPLAVKSSKLRDVTDFRSLSSGVIVAGLPGASTAYVHSDTTGRDAADSHPISAITDLTAALAVKATTNYVNDAITNEATLRISGDVAGTNKVAAATNALWIATTNAIQQIPPYVQTNQVYVATAGTASTVTGAQSNTIASALQSIDLLPYYPRSNPSNYITLASVPVQTQQVYVATAGYAATAGIVTGGQSNTIATALQSADLLPYYPRSNPSNYIALAQVPAQTNQAYVATAGTASTVIGSQSNIIASAVQPGDLAPYYLSSNPSNFITLVDIPPQTNSMASTNYVNEVVANIWTNLPGYIVTNNMPEVTFSNVTLTGYVVFPSGVTLHSDGLYNTSNNVYFMNPRGTRKFYITLPTE